MSGRVGLQFPALLPAAVFRFPVGEEPDLRGGEQDGHAGQDEPEVELQQSG